VATIQAYRESDVERFWKDEDFDRYLPKPGFITDFVMSLRGIETPTIFAFWEAAFVMSTMLKRDAWLEWYPQNIWPNLYVMIVAPPRLCAKSTGINFGSKILQDFHNELPGEMFFKKQINIMSTRATPESLSDALRTDEKKYLQDGKLTTVEIGSELAIMASEASTFLGKQKYNLGLIDRLTHLYDCLDNDMDRTRKDGKVEFKNIYVTFIGATTPEGVRSSIPEEAFEGGFMSRLIVAYQDLPTRTYPFPKAVKFAADPKQTITRKHLVDRLAYLAVKSQGAYTMAPEAIAAHEKFYEEFHESLLKKEDRSERKKNMYHRFDTHLLKLALILRAQQYEPGNVITLEDYIQARNILSATLDRDVTPVEDIGASSHDTHYNRIKNLIQRRPMTRKELLQSMSPYRCYVEEVNKILDSLHSEGVISVTLNGKQEATMSRTTKEVYTWVGKEA